MCPRHMPTTDSPKPPTKIHLKSPSRPPSPTCTRHQRSGPRCPGRRHRPPQTHAGWWRAAGAAGGRAARACKAVGRRLHCSSSSSSGSEERSEWKCRAPGPAVRPCLQRGEGGGAGEEALVQRLLREGVVGGVARPRHHVHRQAARQLREAHVHIPAESRQAHGRVTVGSGRRATHACAAPPVHSPSVPYIPPPRPRASTLPSRPPDRAHRHCLLPHAAVGRGLGQLGVGVQQPARHHHAHDLRKPCSRPCAAGWSAQELDSSHSPLATEMSDCTWPLRAGSQPHYTVPSSLHPHHLAPSPPARPHLADGVLLRAAAQQPPQVVNQELQVQGVALPLAHPHPRHQRHVPAPGQARAAPGQRLGRSAAPACCVQPLQAPRLVCVCVCVYI